MKKIAFYTLLLLASYIGGLFYTMPMASVDSWVQQKAKGRLSWEKMELQWDGVHLQQVTLEGVETKQPVTIENLVVTPQLSALLGGKLAAGLDGELEQVKFQATLVKVEQGIEVEWQAEIEEIEPLAKRLLGDVMPTLKGKGDAQGSLLVSLNPPVMQQGKWESNWQQLSAYGAEVDTGSIQGTIENNRVEMDLSARGDVALSGKLTLRTKLPNWKQSPLSGRVEVRPENGDIAKIFPGGRPVAFQASGVLQAPQWKSLK